MAVGAGQHRAGGGCANSQPHRALGPVKNDRMRRPRFSSDNLAAGTSALVAQRDRFHLAYRLAVRHQLLRSARASAFSSRRVAAATAGSVVGDLALWAWLRGSDRHQLGPRLALDALDAAAWGSVGSGPYDIAILTSLPLSVETGLRSGTRGVVVPAVVAGATSLARRALCQPVKVSTFRWPLIGWAAGVGLARYQRHHREALERRHELELTARRERAMLVGQNDVAMGVDSIVDLLARTSSLLKIDGAAKLAELAGLTSWRAALATRTGTRASYLGVVLAMWQNGHNRHPDLSTVVNLRLPEGEGIVVLSPFQVSALVEHLDSRSLSGTVAVQVADGGWTMWPGQRRRLLVDGESVVLPTDPNLSPAPFDPGPIVLAVSSFAWLVLPATQGAEECPRWAVVPASALSLAAAGWAHRRIHRQGDAGHHLVLWASLAPALVHTVFTSATMRRSFSREGLQHFPFVLGLNAVAILAALYRDDLVPRQRGELWVAGLAIAGLGVVLLPERVRLAHLAGELKWVAAAFLAVQGCRRALADEAARYGEELAVTGEADLAEAYAEGRTKVLSLVEVALQAAWTHLDVHGHGLPSDIAAEVRRRLDEVARRLDELRRSPPRPPRTRSAADEVVRRAGPHEFGGAFCDRR